jgi:hypothetical protein
MQFSVIKSLYPYPIAYPEIANDPNTMTNISKSNKQKAARLLHKSQLTFTLGANTLHLFLCGNLLFGLI